MIRQIVTMPVRNDPAGAGHFGAPRGTRTHDGIDYDCIPGEPVLAVVAGTVTKLGWPYKGNSFYRYVEITDKSGLQHRTMYLEPCVEVGQRVNRMTVVGIAQNVCDHYPDEPKMTPHIHHEVKRGRQYLNPETLEPA